MPRAGLDAEAVVTAAAALADADGLPDLRRRLAARGARELGIALRTAAAGRARGDALAAVAGAYRAYAVAHPGTYAAAQRASDLDEGAADDVVEVVVAVLRGYGLEGDEAIHGARIVRAALHGFLALETGEGFGIPLDLDETFARLVFVLDHGLGAPSG